MFIGCTSLKEIIIPDQVTSIESEAFSGCTNLESVVIGKELSWIGSNAFASCENLQKFYCYSATPPSAYDDTSIYDTFKESYVNYIYLYVGKDYVDSYEANKPWSDFKEIIGINLVPNCDVNGDSNVNVADVVEIKRYELQPNSVAKEKADVTGDGVVDEDDVKVVVNAILR